MITPLVSAHTYIYIYTTFSQLIDDVLLLLLLLLVRLSMMLKRALFCFPYVALL